jgi:putative flippase GtrA
MELTPRQEALATTGVQRDTLWQGLRARLRAHAILVRFAATGATGYIVYQLVFLILYEAPLLWFLPDKGQELRLLGFTHSDARLLITTLVAGELSIVGVFAGHHCWTVRDRVTASRPIWLRFAQFNAKAAVSSLGILTVVVNLLTLRMDVSPYIAIPAGVATAFLWNWVWDSMFIWRSVERRNEGG